MTVVHFCQIPNEGPMHDLVWMDPEERYVWQSNICQQNTMPLLCRGNLIRSVSLMTEFCPLYKISVDEKSIFLFIHTSILLTRFVSKTLNQRFYFWFCNTYDGIKWGKIEAFPFLYFCQFFICQIFLWYKLITRITKPTFLLFVCKYDRIFVCK